MNKSESVIRKLEEKVEDSEISYVFYVEIERAAWKKGHPRVPLEKKDLPRAGTARLTAKGKEKIIKNKIRQGVMNLKVGWQVYVK